MSASQEVRAIHRPRDEQDVYGWQDDCLIAIEDGHPLRADRLLKLPPWRAVLVARVAQRAKVPLEKGTVDQLIAEARAVGGSGKLGNYWEDRMTVEVPPQPLTARCPECRMERFLPEGWQDIMRASMPPGDAASWDGELRCQNGHDPLVMKISETS